MNHLQNNSRVQTKEYSKMISLTILSELKFLTLIYLKIFLKLSCQWKLFPKLVTHTSHNFLRMHLGHRKSVFLKENHWLEF